jgi:hypothetical protein
MLKTIAKEEARECVRLMVTARLSRLVEAQMDNAEGIRTHGDHAVRTDFSTAACEREELSTLKHHHRDTIEQSGINLLIYKSFSSAETPSPATSDPLKHHHRKPLKHHHVHIIRKHIKHVVVPHLFVENPNRQLANALARTECLTELCFS